MTRRRLFLRSRSRRAGLGPLQAASKPPTSASARHRSATQPCTRTSTELAASRARLVEAADEARRQIERDLHDGAQQRLVATALELSMRTDSSTVTPRPPGRCWPERETSSNAASANC